MDMEFVPWVGMRKISDSNLDKNGGESEGRRKWKAQLTRARAFGSEEDVRNLEDIERLTLKMLADARCNRTSNLTEYLRSVKLGTSAEDTVKRNKRSEQLPPAELGGSDMEFVPWVGMRKISDINPDKNGGESEGRRKWKAQLTRARAFGSKEDVRKLEEIERLTLKMFADARCNRTSNIAEDLRSVKLSVPAEDMEKSNKSPTNDTKRKKAETKDTDGFPTSPSKRLKRHMSAKDIVDRMEQRGLLRVEHEVPVQREQKLARKPHLWGESQLGLGDVDAWLNGKDLDNDSEDPMQS